MKRVICVICARSGSTGIPGKNIRPLLDKPLLAHSVQTAVSSGLFDQVVVTSDSSKYLEIASKYGASFLVNRPEELSSSFVSKLGAIKHAASSVEREKNLKFDTIVDLDVTSPLRLSKDIKGALELFNSKNVTSVITGCRSHRSPYTNLVEVNDSGVVSVSKSSPKILSQRQESPRCFDMNASIYIWNRDSFFHEQKVFYDDTLLYEMPFDRSWDIDYEIDFEIVELLMKKRLTC